MPPPSHPGEAAVIGSYPEPMPHLPWWRFVRRFLWLLAAALAAIAALNFLVNPQGLYPVQWLPELTWNTRPAKARMMAEAQPRPQALILGSSRSMKIDPRQVERLTGLPTFNASVNAALAEDLYVFLRCAVERAGLQPKLVLIGLDVEAFHDREAANEYLLQPNALGSYLLKGEARAGRWKRLTNLVNWYQTKLSLQSLWASLGPPRRPAAHFEPNGYVRFDKLEAERATGHYDLRSKVEASTAIYISRYQSYTGPSRERLDYFDATLGYAQEHGIPVVVFLTPMHPDVLAALGEYGYEQRRQEVLQAAEQITRKHGARFVDMSSVSDFGGEAGSFYDGVHLDETNSERLTARLFAGR